MVAAGSRGTYREALVRHGVRRILCAQCGYSKDFGPSDPCRYELWYAASFKGHRLWARNREHLVFLIEWLSGPRRIRAVRDVADRAELESLPKWMSAKNREGCLRCLLKLLESGSPSRARKLALMPGKSLCSGDTESVQGGMGGEVR